MNAQVHTAASGEKSNHSFLITHLVRMLTKYERNLHAEHISESTSSHSSKWRKEHS